jgi:hypothetical protein
LRRNEFESGTGAALGADPGRFAGAEKPRGRHPASGRVQCRNPRLSLWRGRVASAALALAWGVLGIGTALGLAGCGDEAEDLVIPTVYVAAGRVVDPTTDPISGISGARVSVDTDAEVSAVTTDADGYFVLAGVKAGTHRLRAEVPGYVPTLSYDLEIEKNVVDALVPIFTAQQIDSVLAARGAPAWDREAGLFGLFALRSNGLPVGDASVSFAPSPGGTLVQTGDAEDPIVLVNGSPGDFSISVARSGYLWDGPYGIALRPAVLTFAAPRARPNFTGYAFANSSGGAAVSNATVTIVSGPDAGRSETTTFLGQFTFVGLEPGTGRARLTAPGFVPELTWPQPFDKDTTLVQVMVEPDTLTAWIASEAGPALDPTRGTLVVDARAAAGGDFALGAAIQIGAGQGSGGDVSLPLTAGHPALRVNLDPGFYVVHVTAPGFAPSAVIDSVEVRPGEITSTRIDLDPPAPVPLVRARAGGATTAARAASAARPRPRLSAGRFP